MSIIPLLCPVSPLIIYFPFFKFQIVITSKIMIEYLWKNQGVSLSGCLTTLFNCFHQLGNSLREIVKIIFLSRVTPLSPKQKNNFSRNSTVRFGFRLFRIIRRRVETVRINRLISVRLGFGQNLTDGNLKCNMCARYEECMHDRQRRKKNCWT